MAQTQQATMNRSRSSAEWTTLIITSLIVAAMVAALIWHSLTGGDDVSFEVTIDDASIAQHGDAFHVPFAVQNTGKATAEDVLVVVELMDGDQTVDETELTFRFLGDGESAEGVAVFADDPRAYTLEARVTSYAIP